VITCHIPDADLLRSMDISGHWISTAAARRIIVAANSGTHIIWIEEKSEP
jgi:hypothetical protein